MTRAETAEAGLAEERSARAEAEERALKAESLAKRPRLNTAAVERSFPTMDKPSGEEPIDINAEIQRLIAAPGETDEERAATSIKISQLKAQLR